MKHENDLVFLCVDILSKNSLEPIVETKRDISEVLTDGVEHEQQRSSHKKKIQSESDHGVFSDDSDVHDVPTRCNDDG